MPGPGRGFVTNLMGSAVRVAVCADVDVVAARLGGGALAKQLGMSPRLQTMVATAISEVAHNIVTYAGDGEVTVSVVEEEGRRGVQVVARDNGPGIPDTASALQDGYSTAGSLGLGLSGASRLMDEFDLVSDPGRGTTVTMRKWAPQS